MVSAEKIVIGASTAILAFWALAFTFPSTKSSQLEVRFTPYTNGDVESFTIQSLADKPVTITGMIINRGNCPVRKDFTSTLKFGEVVKVDNVCPQAREVELITDIGHFTYGYPHP